MNEPKLEKKWIETSRGKICYFIDYRFENSPTMVFLHGLSANHTTWKNLASALHQLRINVLLVDLRGHGYSDKAKKRDLYKIPVFTKDTEVIIKKEKLEKVILAGYSFGGFIALDYAIKYPEKLTALVLISTNHVNPWKYKSIYFLTWPAYSLLNLLAWLLIWQGRKKYYYYDQEKDLGYWRSTFKGLTTMPLSVNLWMLTEAAHIDFSRDLEKITCPVLIMKSRNDHLVSDAEIADMAEKIKSSKTVIFDETSHFLASRHQEKISDAIIDFLKKKGIICPVVKF